MKLFQMKNWVLTLDEEVWGLRPFKALLDRDKTKDKVLANSEMLFIWYYTDIKSNFLMLPKGERVEAIKKEIEGLPEKWTIDDKVEEALEFYKSNSETVVQQLYKQAVKAANDVGDFLEKTNVLLNERDKADKPIYKIKDITSGLKDVKIIMKNLKEAEKEVIKETEDNEGRTKGSRKFNTFEDLNF